MRKRLKSVLALLESNTQEQLVFNFLEVNQRRPRFEALMVGMLNAAEERMECYAISGVQALNIQRYEIGLDDVNHPFIHVLRSGSAHTWETLHRGVRIDDVRFRHFVHNLPGECGLLARPVFDNNASAYGVIAVFSCQPEHFCKPDNVFSLSYELFQYQLRKLIELDQLRSNLRQIQEVIKIQRQKQQQLDELITELSSATPKPLAGMAKDYSGIDDLAIALDAFECEVLTQRMRQFGTDKKRVAMSLNLSPRTLAYKLMKYGCEV